VSGAIGQVGEAVEQVETVIAVTADSQGPVDGGEREAIVDNLDRATQRIKEAVQDVATMIVVAQEESREAHLEEDATTGDRPPRGDRSRRASGCSG